MFHEVLEELPCEVQAKRPRNAAKGAPEVVAKGAAKGGSHGRGPHANPMSDTGAEAKILTARLRPFWDCFGR